MIWIGWKDLMAWVSVIVAHFCVPSITELSQSTSPSVLVGRRVNLRTIKQLLRSRFTKQEQGHIYRIVSLKLSLSHLCSTDDFVTLPSPCDWPPCFNIYKEGVTKFRKVNQGKALLNWKQQVKYKECSQAPFPAPDFMSFNPSSYILTVCV